MAGAKKSATKKPMARKAPAKAKAAPKQPGRIVAGAASMVSAAALGDPAAAGFARRLEEAQIKATEEALAEGITDPVEIRKRKIAAIEKVRSGA